MLRRGSRWFILACWMAFGLVAGCRPTPPSGLPKLDLQVGGRTVRAEVASTPMARTAGLMFRTHMGENEGMIFLFPDSAPRAFWMKNTLLPLSIAFVDEKGVILNVEDMEPQTLDGHPSQGPAKYALEMNQGWFAKAGVSAGATLRGLEKAPPAE